MLTLLRPLTPPEASFAYMHKLLNGNTQVVTLVTLPFLVGQERVVTAVARLTTLFWCMSVQIVEQDDFLWFCEAEQRPRLEISENSVGVQFSPDRALRAELSDILPDLGPLWRMRVVFDENEGRTHLLFSRNHAISDGYTSAVVLATLVKLLLGEEVGIEYDAPLPLQAWKELSREPVGQKPFTTLQSKPNGYRYALALPESSQPGLTLLQLPHNAVPLMRVVSKKAGCSINDVFAAMFLKGFCGVTGHDDMVLYTAASLRERCTGQSVKNTGCFITVIPTLMDSGADGLFPLAKRCRSALRTGLENWRPPENDHRAIRAAIEQLAGAAVFPGIALTNVGTLPREAQALLAACEYRTVVNRNAGNYGVVLHLSTLASDFSASLAHSEGLMPEAVVTGLKHYLEEEIEAMCDYASTLVNQSEVAEASRV
jgi:hypothetical protein